MPLLHNYTKESVKMFFARKDKSHIEADKIVIGVQYSEIFSEDENIYR